MNRDSLAPPPPTVRRYNYTMPDAKPIPFDSLNLYAVLQERNFFVGARIQDIRQPEPLTVSASPVRAADGTSAAD
jgi:hypothetical protein